MEVDQEASKQLLPETPTDKPPSKGVEPAQVSKFMGGISVAVASETPPKEVVQMESEQEPMEDEDHVSITVQDEDFYLSEGEAEPNNLPINSQDEQTLLHAESAMADSPGV